MPKLVSAPRITYNCSCGATSEADAEEFEELHTSPPTFKIKCAYCECPVTCAPTALIHKKVGSMSIGQVSSYINNRIG